MEKELLTKELDNEHETISKNIRKLDAQRLVRQMDIDLALSVMDNVDQQWVVASSQSKQRLQSAYCSHRGWYMITSWVGLEPNKLVRFTDWLQTKKAPKNFRSLSWLRGQDYRLKPLPLAYSGKSELFQNFTALHEPATTHASHAAAEPNPVAARPKEKYPTHKGYGIFLGCGGRI